MESQSNFWLVRAYFHIIDEKVIKHEKIIGCYVMRILLSFSPRRQWLVMFLMTPQTQVLQGCWEVGMQLQLPHSMLSLIKDIIELQKIHATAHEKSHWSKPSSTTKNFGSIGWTWRRLPGPEIVNTNYNRILNINDQHKL